MKKILSILLVLVLVLASVGAAFAEEGEIDYSQWDTHAAYPQDVVNTDLFTPVKFLVDKKVVEGYEDGLFHAENNVTRAEFIKMLLIATNNHNQLNMYKNAGDFPDVSGHWADEEGYIGAGVALGLINGYLEADGTYTFRPDDEVSYAEMGAMFLRTKQIDDSDLSAYGKWPNNVERYLTMYNMAATITVDDWNDAANRGDVARFLYRNLPK